MIQTIPEPTESKLPPLRDDLQVVHTAPTHDGVPTWTIIDPIRNKHFQIGWAAYQMVSRWPSGTATRLMERVASETTCRVTQEDLDDLLKFLYGNNLTVDPPQGGSRAYVAQAQATHRHWLAGLVHNYLFFKVPLVRPDRFLKATIPFVSPLMTRTAGRVVVLLGLIGFYLIGRQWDRFLDTFLYFFTLEGVALYVVVLCFLKVLHELGHAYTATQYGCRVPTMGVAFLVMFPVLYTDTTEAWRLRSRRQRLFIAAAGTMTELGLAMLATFLWSFLPEGVLRSIAFVVATTSWIMGLMINLNPFLRFDGYYIMADWLGVPNLQDRSFALGRWRMRQLLFGMEAPPPEHFSVALRRKLIIYAWAVWVYRFFLFLGIAVLVYYFFFKALGIVLFVIEILWFIVLPIAREIKEWWNMKSTIMRTGRFRMTAAIVVALGVLLVVPWPTRVSIPAVLEATEQATLFAPAPGQIVEVSVKEGQRVRAGDLLLTLEAPSIEMDLQQTGKRIESLQLLARRQAAGGDELARNQVIVQALKSRISELKGLREKRDNLALRAPISGVVTDLSESLHPGRWVNEDLPLAYLVSTEGSKLHGLAPETEVARLEVGQAARFIPDDPARPSIAAEVREIRQVDEGAFAVPYLASTFGGDIPARKDGRGKLLPETSVYRVGLEILDAPPSWDQAVRGVLHVEGHRWSVAQRVWDRVASILIRESGF